jgi:hypothetical protein
MLKVKFLLIVTMLFVFLFNSTNVFPFRFPVDVSAGYGTTYGGFGGKVTLGQVLFAGGGTFVGETMGNVGIQIPIFFSTDKKYNWTPYIGASYGGIAVQEETYYYSNRTEREKKVVNGYSVFAGYVWGWEFGLFVHVDGGFSMGKVTYFENTPYEKKDKIRTIALDFGVGYRFF